MFGLFVESSWRIGIYIFGRLNDLTKFSGPSLSSFDIESEEVIKHQESEGLLVLSYLSSDNDDKMGTVCASNASFELSDMICWELGYRFGQWGRTRERPQFIAQQ